MKTKLTLITAMCFIASLLAAQTDTIPTAKNPSPSDTSSISLGKTKILIISNTEDTNLVADSIAQDSIEDEKSWSLVGVFNLGANGYLLNNQLALPTQYQQMELDYSKSKSIGFDFMIKGIDLFKKRMYLSPGIGFNWNKYQFKDKQQMLSTQNDTVLFLVDSAITYDKYKLRATYLQVPLLIGFRLGNLDKKYVNIQLGAIAGYNIGSITKAKYILNGAKYKDKIRDDYNINPFKLDAIARVSFGNIGLFGSYSFTSLFEDSKAPSLTPFSVGLTFGSL